MLDGVSPEGVGIERTQSSIDFERIDNTVGKYIQSSGHRKSLTPIYNLQLYLYLKDHGVATDEELVGSLQSLSSTAREEEKAFMDHQSPSIGTEVDIYRPLLMKRVGIKFGNLIRDLSRLGITSRSEIASIEFALPPTSSAEAQWEMIKMLMKIGVFPSTTSPSSLHINFGLKEGQQKIIDMEAAQMAGDMLTYAFVPAERIARRLPFLDSEKKSVDINDVEGTDLESVNQDTKAMKKLEFRTPELIGDRTPELLHAAQQLVQMLLDPTQVDRTEQFKQDAATLLLDHNLSLNAPDDKRFSTAYRVLRAKRQLKKQGETSPPNNLVVSARNIISSYVPTRT